jgi:3-deoxy-7-phosphoheptulonate synthase
MDPELNGSLNINKGLAQMRELMQAVNQLGLAVACEFVDTIVPQYLADLVSWAQVGSGKARARLYAELASGLSMPVGFEAGGGDAANAVTAIERAARPHPFIGVSKQGVAGVVHTTGNGDCHAIVSEATPLADACARLGAAGLRPGAVVDCSYGAQSGAAVARVAEQIASGSTAVSGVLLKSFLAAGAQPPPAQDERPDAAAALKHGVSISEPCVDWDATHKALEQLAAAVKARRAAAAVDAPATAGGGSAAKKARRGR